MVAMRWMAPLALLLVAGCTTKNEVSVTGTDQTSLQASPAGVATSAFVDLEGLGYRVDGMPSVVQQGEGVAVQVAASLPSCIAVSMPSASTTRLTFGPGCTGANGWALTGTVDYVNNGGGVFNVTFGLTLKDTTQTKMWTYTGTKVITVGSSQATVTVPNGGYVQAAFTDSLDTTKNRTYQYVPNLTGNWATPGQVKVWGSYAFQQVGGDRITATVDQATPLIWANGCCKPVSGTISLTVGTSTATAVFGPACGALKLNGNTLSMPSC